MTKTPRTIVEQAGIRFYVQAEFSPTDRSQLACELDRDKAVEIAGKAAVQYQSGPVIEREAAAP